MRRTLPADAALFLFAFSAALPAAEHWPQWRGPELNGASKDAGDCCLSSPAVSEGQIFIRTSGHLWVIGSRKK